MSVIRLPYTECGICRETKGRVVYTWTKQLTKVSSRTESSEVWLCPHCDLTGQPPL